MKIVFFPFMHVVLPKQSNLLTSSESEGILAPRSGKAGNTGFTFFMENVVTMIIDTFERGASYALGQLWDSLFPELTELVLKGGALPNGNYPLAGGPEHGGVMAIVSEYKARLEQNAQYESHDRMADIQLVLEGDEYLDMFPLQGHEKESLHDVQRDLVFYTDKPESAVRVHLKPGIFALLMPGEAHMPCVKACSARVKKLVVKIPADRLSAPASGFQHRS